MKRIILATIMLVAFAFSSKASFKVGNLYYEITSNEEPYTVEVTYEKLLNTSNYSGLSTADIPYTVTYNDITYSVTSIGDNAFHSCKGLTSVDIPSSVTSVGKGAFYGCVGLTSVCIPNSVISIGDYVFESCNGLTSVTISNSVTNIGSKAFYYCSGLTSVTFAEGSKLTSIGEHAFYQCSKLSSVSIPKFVTSIGKSAFYYCSGLTSVNFAEGSELTSIGERAFYGCSMLTSVDIPNSVTSIVNEAFMCCVDLVSATIPNSVTSIGNDVFWGCRKATIYCQAAKKPSGWNSSWIPNYSTVVWGCKIVSLSVNNDSFGTVSGNGWFAQNTSVEISATPNTGYHFTKWGDDNNENPRTITVMSDTAFVANFAINTYTVELSSSDNGSVSGAGTYGYGSEATLIATPNENYHFVEWSDKNTDNPRTITAVSDTAFVANFAIDTYTVTLSGENGSVSGAGTYEHGSEAKLIATPNENYHFVEWSDGNTENPRTITVTENLTLEAIFEMATAISFDAATAVNIYAHHNVIVVENADADIMIYDVTGRLVARSDAASNVSITMPHAGFYIVKCGAEVKRVYLRF